MTERLPTPWSVHHNAECYWVQAADGQRFAFTYYRKAGQQIVGTDRSSRLSQDLARRVAANVARLPALLKRG